MTAARRWVLSGRVQGVGFRPFVYRLAHRYGLCGWVQNQRGQVEVVAQGTPGELEAFGRDLIECAPPLARPRIVASEDAPATADTGFAIRPSEARAEVRVHVPPDQFTCPECLGELREPADRRYRYPFLNCTQCGPRYTLIARLPYDRPNTSMAGFPLCPACEREYRDPLDRRFHAEPIACPDCGPRLTFRLASHPPVEATGEALAACVQALRAGEVIAVKGVGGYHLLCDARLDAPVARLRAAKPRPHKPLAVMYPGDGRDGTARLEDDLRLRPEETSLLTSPVRPIVLATRTSTSRLSPLVAPGLSEVGVMLPYSPLHHLLLQDFGGPLVATSANVSGEPVLTEAAEVERRLGHVAGAFLHHDRPILRPADDPVFRSIGGRMRALRLGRGCAPLEVDLPARLPGPVLAIGAHMKNTVALGWEDRAVVSPHIGDMGTPRGLAVLEQVASDLQDLYGVRAETIVCDAHPGYTTSRWARSLGLPVRRVYHHHAHASALAGEHRLAGPTLVFTWDGVGYGADGTLWGGEALLGCPGHWRRVGSLRPFRLPGGERAGREPWRSAAALCWETGVDCPVAPAGSALLREAWGAGLNAPLTTAVGRLFDAAAGLVGLVSTASFEGQGPMYLEAAAEAGARAGPEVPVTRAGDLWLLDWEPLLPWLLDRGLDPRERAAGFHESLARALLAQALAIAAETGVHRVGLCGGVFQNRRLAERASELLEDRGFEVLLPEEVPANDGGISFGQVVESLGACAPP
jgi:hydrogenase maturation protein HypF